MTEHEVFNRIDNKKALNDLEADPTITAEDREVLRALALEETERIGKTALVGEVDVVRLPDYTVASATEVEHARVTQGDDSEVGLPYGDGQR